MVNERGGRFKGVTNGEDGGEGRDLKHEIRRSHNLDQEKRVPRPGSAEATRKSINEANGIQEQKKASPKQVADALGL